MEIKIDAGIKRLLRELLKVTHKRGSLPVLKHFRMDICRSEVTIEATDLERLVSVSFPCDTAPGEENTAPFTVDGKRFVEALKSLKGAVTITPEDNKIKIKQGSFETYIESFSVDDYPCTKSMFNGDRIAVFDSAFIPAVQAAINNASTDQSRSFLETVFVEKVGERLSVVGTDGHRLACTDHRTYGDIEDFDFLIPRTAAATLCAFLKGTDLVEVYRTDTENIYIESGKTKVFFRLCPEVYPKYRKIIESVGKIEKSFTITTDRKALIEAVKMVSTSSKREKFYLRIESVDGSVTIENVQTGAKMKFCEHNDPYCAAFDGHYFAKILGCFAGAMITFQFDSKSNSTPIQFSDKSELTVLLMPINSRKRYGKGRTR